jgi:diguanylate cyclase (GGDEF)-like protein/PAS domain S-box-containing protein
MGTGRSESHKPSDERFYRELVENANDIIFRNDKKGNFLYINPYGTEILGYSSDEFLKLNYADIIPLEYKEDVRKFYIDQYKNGLHQTYLELPIIKKDGRTVWVGQFVTMLKNENGDIEFFGIARDITEIKSIQDALLESEEKYRTILNSMREGYYQTDLVGRVLFVNQAILDMSGYTANEMIGQSYKKLFSEETAQKIYNLFHEVYTTGNPMEFSDWELITKDGTKKSIAASIELIQEKTGKKTGFRGMIFDLTDKKRFINALIDSERRLRDLVETLPEIVFELDSQGTILYVNKRTIDVLGYTREELIGKNALNIVIPEDRKRAIRGLTKTLAGKRYTAQNYVFQGKKGQIPIHLYTAPMMESGIVVGMRGIAIDISEILQAEKNIQESHEKFRTMIENSSEIISIIDQNGIIKFESQSVERILGYEPSERMGTNALEQVHIDDRSIVAKSLANSAELQVTKTAVFEYRYKHKDGTWRYLETTATNLLKNKLINGILLNTRDVTEKKIAEKSMINREEKYRNLYNNALVALLTIDTKNYYVLQTNDLGHIFFGYDKRDEIIGLNFISLFENQKDAEAFRLRLAEQGEVLNFEIPLVAQNGKKKWAEISARFNSENGTISVVIVDISRRKETEEMLTYYTFYDQLTQLPNREMFSNKLKTEILKSCRQDHRKVFAVMCLGIDRFKYINEMHGQITGDKLLQKIATILKISFREDDLVARLDGDKFIILFTEIGSPESIAEIVQKAFSAFSDPFIVDDHIFLVTISIGVSIFPHDGKSGDVLMRNAETAMYQAKEKGRNTYYLYDEKLNTEIIKRIRIEEELRHAIMRNEFLAFYQPQVRQDGFIIGMESLIRWQSPERGLVPPIEFIPIAEKNGMIEEIGNLILFEACLQNARWQAMGLRKVRVAVNLSPYQFNKADLGINIARVLRDSRLDPKWLELEITESGIMSNETESIEKLRELKSLGVSISIDDFGTGYSSLSKLRDYPIETLKIDKSFIDNIPHDQKSAMIARSIIDLAHNLGFKVVAEGVENKEQLSFLVQHRCDYYQGYYFFKPLPSKDFEEKIKM